MSLLPDLAVCIWLLPLIVQIILPLAMLGVWLVSRLFTNVSAKGHRVSEVHPAVQGETVEEAA